MPESPNGRTLAVLQITDTHLHAAADSRMRGVTTYETFLGVLEAAQRDTRWPPDVILATGDIVQDESRAGYERFRSVLAPFGIPVLSIPGNHDDPKLMGEILNAAPFQFCGERRIGDWSLIMLSTFLAGEDAGGLGPARLAGLRKALEVHGSQHVLVCMHHHPLAMGSAWLDGVALRDAGEFWKIIHAHSNVRVVLCGHVHQAADSTVDGVRFLASPSTCAQFLPKSEFFALDDRPPGFRWLMLNPDGSVDTRVDWTERARS